VTDIAFGGKFNPMHRPRSAKSLIPQMLGRMFSDHQLCWYYFPEI